MGNKDKAKVNEFVLERLYEMQDMGYRDFHSKLVPTVDRERIIGVRSPNIKKFAKEFSKMDICEEFIADLPHKYLEEYSLHINILNKEKNIEKLIEETEKVLPYIDNWAICDSFSPKVFKKYPELIYEKILKWLESDDTYTVRFGIVTLMNNYLDENFDKKHLDLISNIKTDEYYINMAIAWYYSYAIIKQYEETIGLIESKSLGKFVQNKSIQKAVESRRVDDDTKEYLKKFKIK
ncbi:MAG: DNA alkylation repair protein [Peptostreptococcus sp.]|uniref:DNA alkylation repair protein n=1 Tax=Peptostreptococcus sp. TaxID=1262 RepID=UPI002FC8FB7A